MKVKTGVNIPSIISAMLLMILCLPFPAPAGEPAGDGRFIAYDNGTVLDTTTNLMWAARDNGSNINWANAKRYCEKYRGGGYTDWRMPTQDELEGIFDKSKSYRSACGDSVHLTELIRLSCCCIWAIDAHGSYEAHFFGFTGGSRAWGRQSLVKYNRALPVRSAK